MTGLLAKQLDQVWRWVAVDIPRPDWPRVSEQPNIKVVQFESIAYSQPHHPARQYFVVSRVGVDRQHVSHVRRLITAIEDGIFVDLRTAFLQGIDCRRSHQLTHFTNEATRLSEYKAGRL